MTISMNAAIVYICKYDLVLFIAITVVPAMLVEPPRVYIRRSCCGHMAFIERVGQMGIPGSPSMALITFMCQRPIPCVGYFAVTEMPDVGCHSSPRTSRISTALCATHTVGFVVPTNSTTLTRMISVDCTDPSPIQIPAPGAASDSFDAVDCGVRACVCDQA